MKHKQAMAVIMAAAVSLTAMPSAAVTALAAPKAAKTRATVKAPKNLKVRKVSKKQGNRLKVSWKKVKKGKVQVYLKAGKGKYKKVGTTAKKTFVTKALKNDVKYKVRVRVKAGKSYSAFVTYKKSFIFKSAGNGQNTDKNNKDNGTGKQNTGDNKGGSGQNTGDNKGGSGQNTGDNKGGSGQNTGDNKGDSGKQTQSSSVIDESRSKIVNNRWAQYVVVAFDKGYNKDNTTIQVDGVDVTDKVSNVTDDGSIVKWEISSLDPANLTVTSRQDPSVKESVTLSDNKNPQKPVVKDSEAPAYFMAHGPVSVFDYYLTNYDDEGNVRTKPAKTTFATKQADDRIRSYAADAELKEDGSGQVEILFNYTTDEDKAWFDAIPDTGALELVSNSEQKSSLNNHMKYTKDTTRHGSSIVGRITVPLGQDNFYSNGKYYIRTKSAGHKSAMTLINVVNEKAPTILLSESGSIRSGQNIHFQINDMVEGIQESIEKVTLTDPTGKTTELKHIDDWFHYGNTGLFVIYNDTARDSGNGVNHTQYKGKYTLHIQAAGFKDMEKSFEVDEGKTVPAAQQALASSKKMDALSSATFSTGGDAGSGGSGSLSVSADLVFDADLLANALIMDNLKMDNSYATAIAKRWESEVIPDYVYAKDGKTFYKYTEYYNAVSDAKLNGKYLSFAEYAKTADPASTADVRPSHVKMVLEDNMLGDITDNYLGQETPKLKLTNGTAVKEGEDAVFTCADPDYLKAISSIHENDQYYGLSSDKWEVKDNQLIIKASALKLGDNFFTIKADGYQQTSVQISYQKTLENVSLKTSADSYQAEDDVKIEVQGSKGDFLKNLSKVTVNDGTRDKNVLTRSAGGDSGNDWYEINADRTELTLKGGNFRHEGDYTVTVSSQYYKDQMVKVHVTAKEENPDAAEAPEVTGIEKTSSLFDTYYGVSFNADDDAIRSYVNNITSVKVGNTVYSGWQYQVAYKNNSYSKDAFLKLDADGFSSDSDTKVVITAKDYRTLTFTVTPSGTLR